MARSTSWARDVAVEVIASRAVKRSAALAVRSHRWDETDGGADTASSAAPGSTIPRRMSAAELFAGAGQPAAERAGGASELTRRLVERDALEIAEHDGRTEDARQAVDLAVQDVGLVAVEQGVIGGRGRRLDGFDHGVHDISLLVDALASQAGPGLAGGAQRHAIEPGAEPVGVAERTGLARQDEEDGLEGVLGEMAIAQELAADAEHHRAMPGHQGGEGGLVAAVVEPLDELAVGEPDERAIVEERAELAGDRGCG